MSLPFGRLRRFEPTSCSWGQPLPVSDVGGHEGSPAEEEGTSGVSVLVCFNRDLSMCTDRPRSVVISMLLPRAYTATGAQLSPKVMMMNSATPRTLSRLSSPTLMSMLWPTHPSSCFQKLCIWRNQQPTMSILDPNQ